MTGRLRLIPALVFCAGCVGVASLPRFPVNVAGSTGVGDGFISMATEAQAPLMEFAVMEPDIARGVQRARPGLIQSIHANGIVWLGYNVGSAQAGDLDYDGGKGPAFGLAFGNGEDIKRFVELVFVETRDHEYRDTSGTVLGDALQTHYYIGARRYLLPVTGARSRVAPFVVGGITYNRMSISGPGGTPSTDIADAFGLGFYIGTGVEFYIGPQLALGLDIRVSYWNWESRPVDTGEQRLAGSNVGLVYHF